MSQYLRDILFLSLALVINGLDELTTTPGSDVTLESRCSSDGVVTLIEWKRSELQPLKYVFFYRNARPYENYQNPRYRGRVELRNPEIKDGDVSITVKNVNVDDSGVYECRSIVKIGGNNVESKRVINLRVIEPPEQMQAMLRSEEQRMNPIAEVKPHANVQETENTKVELIGGIVAVALVVAAAVVVVVGVRSGKCQNRTKSHKRPSEQTEEV